jgi:hypothetical protein
MQEESAECGGLLAGVPCILGHLNRDLWNTDQTDYRTSIDVRACLPDAERNTNLKCGRRRELNREEAEDERAVHQKSGREELHRMTLLRPRNAGTLTEVVGVFCLMLRVRVGVYYFSKKCWTTALLRHQNMEYPRDISDESFRT